MRRILPVIFSGIIFFVFVQNIVSAQTTPTVDPNAPTATLTQAVTNLPSPTITGVITPVIYQPGPSPIIPDNTWVVDPEVTFAGKNAARSGLLLDWTLRDYAWSRVKPGESNPIMPFWILIRNIIYAVLVFFVMATAFVLIATRGKSLSFRKFIPRFIWIVVLITFSFSVIAFIYQSFDAIQGFFLRSDINQACPPTCISQKDLLFVGWDYRPFFGLRLTGDSNTESAFISLLFVKITALTYYAMVVILLVRKIIMWFFIIVSPVFPLLLFYYPLRNTAKIWVGEFFRWLLYGPLFAIFLAGLVSLWRRGIPMLFDFSKVDNQGEIIFPTAINILLGGPGQLVTLTNSINYPDTFALYLVALIMLWMVILVPWILLRIFLDHAWSMLANENSVVQQAVGFMMNRNTPPATPIAPPPLPGGSTGTALNLPFKTYNVPTIEAGQAKSLPIGQAMPLPNVESIEINRANAVKQSLANAELLNLTNLSIPSIRDIAKYETTLRTSTINQPVSVTQMQNRLVQLANPSVVTNTIDRERITKVRDRLVQTSQQGNQIANSILQASKVVSQMVTNVSTTQLQNVLTQAANPEKVTSFEKETYKELHDTLVKESQQGNNMATTLLSITEKTSEKELQKIHDQLIKESQAGNNVATATLATALNKEQTPIIQAKLQEIAKPASADTTSQKNIIREALLKESQQGNTLATEILSVNEKTTAEETQKLKEKIINASLKGDKTAASVLQEMTKRQQSEVALPDKNRVQQVSLEDYEAVKKIWQENYNNMNLPQGITDRKGWINQEMSEIDEIISLLTSNDEQKVQEGMQHVSNILPFLMLGGFSQEEIVAYLNAKKEAGKSVIETIEQESEETLVSVDRKTSTHAVKSQTMSVTSADEEEMSEESVISNISGKVVPRNITINTQLLQLTNLPLPTMKDVVRFEIGLAGKNTVSKEEVTKVKEMLQILANPLNVSSETERQRIEGVRTQLLQNSQQGDQLATSIINAINHIANITNGSVIQQSSVFNSSIFQQLANPSLISESVEKEKLTELREKLTTAQSQGNQFASSFLSTLNTFVQSESAHTQTVFQQLANPALATSESEKERYTQVHEMLTKESQQGNQLAAAILSVTPATSAQDLEQLKLSIQAEKAKGSEFATLIASFLQMPINEKQLSEIKQNLSEEIAKGEPLARDIDNLLFAKSGANMQLKKSSVLPKENRVQPVNLEDYESVRQMWEENYKTMDLPEGVSERKSWIAEEVNHIESIIGLLTSSEQDKNQQGMQEVGNILPFLLLGGFSQDEIVAYLKAKKEAAKSVLTVLEKEEANEETMVDVTKQSVKRTTTTSQSTQVMEEENEANSSVLGNIGNIVTARIAQPKATVNTQLLTLTSLPLPTMKDVVKFEVGLLNKNAKEQNNVITVKNILTQLANPAIIKDTGKREQIERVREVLIQNSNQGDQLASSIVNAINHIAVTSRVQPLQVANIKEVFQQLANPGIITSTDRNERATVTALHETLVKESEKGNTLATSILSVKDTMPEDEIKKIQQQVFDQKGSNLVAKDIATLITTPTNKPVQLPTTNRVQAVSVEDYEAVRQMWEENYKTVDVPTEMHDRAAWIKSDISNIDQMITLLSSNEEEQVEAGMQQVGNILPFLLLGGFSQEEIVAYLKAKKEAGKSVLTQIEKESNEEYMVNVEKRSTNKSYARTQSVPTINEENGFNTSVSGIIDGIVTAKVAQPKVMVNTQLLELTNLPLPTMRDIALYERGYMSRDAQVSDQIKNVKESLLQITNPGNIKETEKREQVEKIKQTLIQNSSQGDQLATAIITAVNQIALASHLEPVVNQRLTKEQILQQIANPEVMQTGSDKSKIITLHDKVVKEKEHGNPLASNILSVNSGMPSEAMQKVLLQIVDEKERNSLAKEVAGVFTSTQEKNNTVNLPHSNRIQNVSVEDYESVKQMWEENYKKLAIPQDTKDRSEWIKKEIESIDYITSLLASDDDSKVQEGMGQVGNILPFLLLGGFAQSEIIAYLQAKKEAAKSVLTSLQQQSDEETFVNVVNQNTARTTNMTNSASVLNGDNVVNTSSGVANQIQSNSSINKQLLSMTNLPLPTMKDIASYEKWLVSKDNKSTEINKVKETLTQLANPEIITDPGRREEVEKVRERLVEGVQQGDQTATAILTAINHLAVTSNLQPLVISSDSTEQVLQQIANPELIQSVSDKAKFIKLHEKIMSEKEQGNVLASVLLSVTPDTSHEEVQKVEQQILTEKDKNSWVKEVAEVLPLNYIPHRSIRLPETNKIQPVSVEDYESVRQTWEENYKTVELPEGMTDRRRWIGDEVKHIEGIVSLLTSEDGKKKEEGMDEVGNILPFLLLGGFSEDEIVAYLRAKEEAGKSVLTQLEKEESNEEGTVDSKVGSEKTYIPQAQQISENNKAESIETGVQVGLNNTLASVEKTVGLKVPTIQDLVGLEVSHLTNIGSDNSKEQTILSTLKGIANPTTPEERKLREKLYQQSQAGNLIANSFINAINYSTKQNEEWKAQQVLLGLAFPEKITREDLQKQFKDAKQNIIDAQKHSSTLSTMILHAVEIVAKNGLGNDESEKAAKEVLSQVKLGTEKGDKIALLFLTLLGYAEELQKMTVMLPKANLIQQISLDEYEKVKQLWKEQYEKLDPPAGVNRVEWIKRDVQIISEVITALDSEDTTTIHQALEKVAQIVPFLLLGGFTLTETQAYLRAKLEAAKSVLEVLEAKQEEVSSRIADDKTFNEQPMSMSLDEAKTT